MVCAKGYLFDNSIIGGALKCVSVCIVLVRSRDEYSGSHPRFRSGSGKVDFDSDCRDIESLAPSESSESSRIVRSCPESWESSQVLELIKNCPESSGVVVDISECTKTHLIYVSLSLSIALCVHRW